MSLGSQGGSRTPQPLHELAMAKDEVKARLAPIPVFTVANPKNEFVLVAGEVSDAWLRDFHAARMARSPKPYLCLPCRTTHSSASSSSNEKMLRP